MRILVTGGAGFIGRRLVASLAASGHAVRVLDALTEQVHGPAAPPPPELAAADFRRGDVRDAAGLADAVADVDAVVHLAAETGVGQSMYEVARYEEVNGLGTARLLQALAERRRPVRVVLASSRAVYGEGRYRCRRCGEVDPPARAPDALGRAAWDPVCPGCGGPPDPVATDEAAPTRPASVYAATKLNQEHLVRVVGAAYGFSTVVLRYFNVYGPGQSLGNPYTGILSTFAARAMGGNAIEVYEDGRESRDFVFVDDVVAATRRALDVAVDAGSTAVFNVGTGASVSILALAQAVLAAGGWDVPIRVTGAYRVGDVRHAFADPRRAREVLGFAATTPLDDGLRQWLRWVEGRGASDATDAAAAQLAARGLYRVPNDG